MRTETEKKKHATIKVRLVRLEESEIRVERRKEKICLAQRKEGLGGPNDGAELKQVFD